MFDLYNLGQNSHLEKHSKEGRWNGVVLLSSIAFVFGQASCFQYCKILQLLM